MVLFITKSEKVDGGKVLVDKTGVPTNETILAIKGYSLELLGKTASINPLDSDVVNAVYNETISGVYYQPSGNRSMKSINYKLSVSVDNNELKLPVGFCKGFNEVHEVYDAPDLDSLLEWTICTKFKYVEKEKVMSASINYSDSEGRNIKMSVECYRLEDVYLLWYLRNDLIYKAYIFDMTKSFDEYDDEIIKPRKTVLRYDPGEDEYHTSHYQVNEIDLIVFEEIDGAGRLVFFAEPFFPYYWQQLRYPSTMVPEYLKSFPCVIPAFLDTTSYEQ